MTTSYSLNPLANARVNHLPFSQPRLLSKSGFLSPLRWGVCRWDSNNASNFQIALAIKENRAGIMCNEISSGQIRKEEFVSTTGVSEVPSKVLYFTNQQLLLVGFTACGMLGALSCFFLAAIPTLLSMKKAAKSFEKLADATREELPSTMAAMRLSGMEISDLTMELSDLGQEITAGIRSSTRAVRAAEDGLRRMGSYATTALWQDQKTTPMQLMRPAVALAARNAREGIVRARKVVYSLIMMKRVFFWLHQYRYRIKQRKLRP